MRAFLATIAAVVLVVLAVAVPAEAQREPDGCVEVRWGGVSEYFTGEHSDDFEVINNCNAPVYFMWRDNSDGRDINRVILQNGARQKYNKFTNYLDPGERYQSAVRELPRGVGPEMRYCVQWSSARERAARGAAECERID